MQFPEKGLGAYENRNFASIMLAALVVPLTPAQAGHRKHRKHHRHHSGGNLQQVQERVARYAQDYLLQVPPGTLASVSITEGTDVNAAEAKNVRDLRAAINGSNWSAAAKTSALATFPAGLTSGSGSGNWSGETTGAGYCFCWTRTVSL
jgi:hypothetical protein